MLQSVLGLRYSEARRICHFDIKPANMVYKNGRLKIVDLGTAIGFTLRSAVFKPLGTKENFISGYTPEYAPPEFLRGVRDGREFIGSKIDVYCWGMSFYQLITKMDNIELGRLMKHRIDIEENDYNLFLDKVRTNKKLREFDPKEEISSIISGWLKYNPEERLTFEAIEMRLKCIENEACEDKKKRHGGVLKKDWMVLP
eukprot:TRINITY_DN1180_c0_g1_i7.p3 TRINITY_DN1180_c0_g1~~TRINITY_DN1180_c0_g1_i7.p3  ORF type:complete len:199 (+),score=15.07 TRINITY_DN1180_c0_g1_i7:370-966(+)